MRAIDLFRQYRQSINPPYASKDFLIFGITIFILLVVPLTVIITLQVRDIRKKAAGPAEQVVEQQKSIAEFVSNEILIKVKKPALGKIKTKPKPTDIGIASLNKLNKSQKVKKFQRSSKPTKKSKNKNHEVFRWYKVTLPGKKEIIKEEVEGTWLVSPDGTIQESGLSKSQKLKSTIAEYKKDPNVEYAEPNFIAKPLETIPNDPDFSSQQWGPQRIRAPEAWDITTGSSSVVVAVVDTGVTATHPDLAGKVLPGYDFVDNDDDPTDEHSPIGHGTLVAGIIGAVTNNAIGIAGLSWESPILSIRVCDASGSCLFDAVSDGIVYAVDNGAKIINLSLGGRFSSSTLEDAVNYAWDQNVLVVAAAGNSRRDVDYPAAYPNVVAVGATDRDDQKAWFSSFGPQLDIVAPGVSIYSTNFSDSYTGVSGTSFSSPHAAGAAALLLSHDPSLTNEQVRNILESSALDLGDSGWDQFYGWGMVDICEAFNEAGVTCPVDSEDTEDPTVSITSPSDGATVSGTVNVTVDAEDN